MSHSYSSYRSHGGQRSGSYGSRSTSTGTPPQTPTIRVTSPVPDAIGVIDIWDPEVVEDDPEPRSNSPSKTYSFRYREDGSSSSKKVSDRSKNFADSSMQVDLTEVEEVLTTTIQSLLDDDGLKTAGGSEESSECEEISQISAVTQVCANRHEPSPETDIDKDECEGQGKIEHESAPSHTATVATEAASPPTVAPAIDEESHHSQEMMMTNSSAAKETQSKWNESLPSSSTPIKTTHGRSFSLFSSSPSSPALVLNQSGKPKKTRRYSSMECAVVSSLESMLANEGKVSHGAKMLSPTPESALEMVQSPQTDEEAATASDCGRAVSLPQSILQEEEDDNDDGVGGDEDDEVDRESGLMTDDPDKTGEEGQAEQVEEEVAADDEEKKHEPSCNLFERLNALKEDEELVSLANDFVQHLLRAAQEEALRRGHVQSKIEQKSKLSLELQHVAVPKSRNSGRKWYRRLRSILLRTLTCTCVPTHPNIQSPL